MCRAPEFSENYAVIYVMVSYTENSEKGNLIMSSVNDVTI